MFTGIQKKPSMLKYKWKQLLCDYWFRSILRISSTIFKWNDRLFWVKMQTLSSWCDSAEAFHRVLMSTLRWKKTLVVYRTSRRDGLLWVLEMFCSTVKSTLCWTVEVLIQIPDVLRAFAGLWPGITPALNTMCSQQPACHDLDLQEKPSSQHFCSAAHSLFPPPQLHSSLHSWYNFSN